MSRQIPFHPSDEDRIAADMTRELEAMTMTTAVQPSDEFADRVMRAIADEPLPQPVRAFGLALLGGHVRAAVAAIGDAWRTISSAPAPLAVRAQAVGLVLVVLVGSLTLAGGATVGALGLFRASSPTPSAPIGTPSPSPSAEPSPSPLPSPEASPSETPDATESAEPTETTDQETAQPTQRPRTATPTPTGTDDHGGGGGGGGGRGGPGPGSGSGGGDDHTQSPTSTDDHGGG